MSLALVQVPLTDFQRIYAHVVSYMPAYRNMHLREARYQNKKRVLRYLHALHAPGTGGHLEGAISGPGVFWRYRLRASGMQTQIQVLAHKRGPKDDARIQRTFLQEILDRVQEEQSGNLHYPTRLPGQFYLKRRLPGMLVGHQNCQSAIASGALDPRFVSQLQAWNFALLLP